MGETFIVPRGLKLNNPGNIRLSMESFEGEIPSDDKSFKRFTSMEMGVRAVAKILHTYYKVHKLKTIAGIIGRYSPRNENDTDSYVEDVCGTTGLTPTKELDLNNRDVLQALTKAVIKHEQGFHSNEAWTKYCDNGTIARGVERVIKPEL